MNALEIIGAAGIWALLLGCGVFLGLTAFAFLTVAFDRWRIHRAFWHFKGWGWLSEDELDEYLDRHAYLWWREVKDETAWCRSNDFKKGMRAAAYHLLRDHLHIVKRRHPPNTVLDGSTRPQQGIDGAVLSKESTP